VESGAGAASAEPVHGPSDRDVQRLRRSGGQPVRRHGPAEVLLKRLFKPAVFLACLAPGLWLGIRAWRFFVGGDFLALGPDATKTLQHETGEAALVILFVTLSITPLRRLTGWNLLQSARRMLGVWAFTYSVLHLGTYLVLDQLCYSTATCQFRAIKEDILKRRFIFVGMAAFAILLPLAITSTAGWVRRLKKNWQRLHRLVYLAAALAVVHYVWIQKSDIRVPLRYGAVLAVLLAVRVWFAWRKRRQAARPFSPSHARSGPP
jgi:sulfoxide reductase heme-binding subunit YedZ